MSPPVSSDSPRNILKMAVDDSGEASTPSRAGSSQNSCVVMESCVEVLAMCSSRHICCTRRPGMISVCTQKHPCYEGWCKQRSAQKEHEQMEAHMSWQSGPLRKKKNAWEFLMGTVWTRVSRLEELRAENPEECQAKMPWHRNCDMTALWMAYCALADEDMPALKGTGWHGWSELLEPRSLAGSQAKVSLNLPETVWKRRGLNDGPTWATLGRCGAQLARKEPSP